MDPNNLVKTYTNGEISVVWKPALCQHSTICWKGENGLLPVFNPREKPWIKITTSKQMSQRRFEFLFQ
jgi:uncharacterized Fe-S cluster protein YjdI